MRPKGDAVQLRIGSPFRDMHQYLDEIKRWGCERAQRFREAG